MNMNNNMMGGEQMMGNAPERKPCRYFSTGVCRFGNNCNFSHDAVKKETTVCRYFLMGSCSYGARCFYEHSTGMTSRPNEHHPPQPMQEAQPQQQMDTQ